MIRDCQRHLEDCLNNFNVQNNLQIQTCFTLALLVLLVSNIISACKMLNTKIHTNIIAKNITRSATFLNFHCLNQLVKAGGGSRACSLQLSNHLVCSDPPSHAFPGQQGIPQFPHPHPRQQGIPHPSVNEALIFAGESA